MPIAVMNALTLLATAASGATIGVASWAVAQAATAGNTAQIVGYSGIAALVLGLLGWFLKAQAASDRRYEKDLSRRDDEIDRVTMQRNEWMRLYFQERTKRLGDTGEQEII